MNKPAVAILGMDAEGDVRVVHHVPRKYKVTTLYKSMVAGDYTPPDCTVVQWLIVGRHGQTLGKLRPPGF